MTTRDDQSLSGKQASEQRSLIFRDKAKQGLGP